MMKNKLTIFLAIGLLIFASCKNEVPTASKIQLSETSMSLSEGLTAKLTAKVLPEGADQAVTWKALKPEIADVDEEGNVTAVAGGKAYVVASSGTVSAGCLVRVVARVTGVKLDKHEMSVELDESALLTAQVLPEIADNDTVYWKSTHPEIAVVGNGIVTALRIGETEIVVITAEGGFTDTCKVSVIKSVGAVVLDKQEAKINIGEQLTLTADVRPATATIKDLTWSSSDMSVATVDQNGVITAVDRGFATITATAHNGVKGTCSIEVYAPVTGITVDRTTLEMYVGDRDKLVATVIPANANNQRVTWTSNAATKVSVVSTTGVITAKAAGTATITATTYESKKTATCEVTVIQGTKAVTGITLDKPYLRLAVGGSYELYANIIPRDAANKGVTWKTSSSKVASVTAAGLVKAVDCGTAEITATTKDGSFVATCYLTVVGFDTNTQGFDDGTYIWND